MGVKSRAGSNPVEPTDNKGLTAIGLESFFDARYMRVLDAPSN